MEIHAPDKGVLDGGTDTRTVGHTDGEIFIYLHRLFGGRIMSSAMGKISGQRKPVKLAQSDQSLYYPYEGLMDQLQIIERRVKVFMDL